MKAVKVIIIVVTTVITALIAVDRKDTMAMDLTQFKWKKRLILIFAPDGRNPLFKELQSKIMAQKAEVEDRDLVVFEILERGQSRMNTAHLDQEAVDSIRKRLAVPQSTFRVILIGKDGGMKLERDDQAGLEEIFERIDSMPMRKNEIRQKNQRF
ncbi:MAG: DUF4174 domain-containing protein [Nitrospinales bacterium]